MTGSFEFWDALAPHHGAVENSYLDVPSIRRILDSLHDPVLVVGAGQGLIVAELRHQGLQCDGLDLSPEMIRYARLRRGLTLVEADARAMPFAEGTYRTIIYATGVIDFMDDEEEVGVILREGRRVVQQPGNIIVAFYKLSPALQAFSARVGLLRDNALFCKQSLAIYLLNPAQMVSWVAHQAGVSLFRAATMLLAMSVSTTMQEKAITFRMQRIFKDKSAAIALLNAAPERQPYRDEAEIRNVFRRLAIPIRQVRASGSCLMVQI